MSPLSLASIETKPNRGWIDESVHAISMLIYEGHRVRNVLLYSTMKLVIQRTWNLRAAVKIHQRWRSDPAMVRSSAPLLCRVWSVPSKMCTPRFTKMCPLRCRVGFKVWPLAFQDELVNVTIPAALRLPSLSRSSRASFVDEYWFVESEYHSFHLSIIITCHPLPIFSSSKELFALSWVLANVVHWSAF